MREILFRGKRTDNGEWVEGHLIWYEDGRARITPRHIDIFCLKRDERIIQHTAYEVFPETIGQYTGLTASGTKIFEGDIVKGKDNLERNLEVGGYIDHKNGSFVIVGDLMTHYRWLDYELEVIGNIHDNPELLKPSFKPEYRDGDPDAPICPNCRTPLNEMEDCDCGQKIDWSEE